MPGEHHVILIKEVSFLDKHDFLHVLLAVQIGDFQGVSPGIPLALRSRKIKM
jgi:hypothetical protein